MGKSCCIASCILCVILLIGCNNGDKHDITDNNKYDHYISIGEESLGFNKLIDDKDAYVGINNVGLLYIDNKSDRTLGIEVSCSSDNSVNAYTISEYSDSIISLTSGPNFYNIRLLKLHINNEFKPIYSTSRFVNCDNEALQLYPSYYCQYYDYFNDVALINKDVFKGSIDELNILMDTYEYLCNYSYDSDLADELTNGECRTGIYRPDMEKVFNDKSGICLDMSSLCASMLRVEGIHCDIWFGWYKNEYHAWVVAYVDGHEYIIDSVNKNFGLVDSFSDYKFDKNF